MAGVLFFVFLILFLVTLALWPVIAGPARDRRSSDTPDTEEPAAAGPTNRERYAALQALKNAPPPPPRRNSDTRPETPEDAVQQLLEEGRTTLPAVRFGVNATRLTPESKAALKPVGQLLQQTSELRLRIEGHTCDLGSSYMNQHLSQGRADSVVLHLSGEYGIDKGRLEAVGYGSARPTAPTNPEGRHQNRRVELVRLDED